MPSSMFSPSNYGFSGFSTQQTPTPQKQQLPPNQYLASQHNKLRQSSQGSTQQAQLISQNFKADLLDGERPDLFEKTELLLKPPNIYRQTLDVDNLITVCSKKLQEDPTHKKALFIRASQLLKKGRYNETIEDSNQLMKLDSQNAGAFYTRGCAFEKLGEIDKAIIDFTTVLEIDPNHINAAYARGACENKRGNFAKAIDDYNMALEKDQERPTSPSGNRRIKLQNMNYILDQNATPVHEFESTS